MRAPTGKSRAQRWHATLLLHWVGHTEIGPFPAHVCAQEIANTLAALVFNTKYAYWFSNGVGIVKVCTIIFVIITGFVVLGGNTKVENPKANFQDAWSGSSKASAYGMTTALYRIIFSYGGYNNAFNVANEVKNPVKSLKIYATAALTIVYLLYMFANVAFFAAGKSAHPIRNAQGNNMLTQVQSPRKSSRTRA